MSIGYLIHLVLPCHLVLYFTKCFFKLQQKEREYCTKLVPVFQLHKPFRIWYNERQDILTKAQERNEICAVNNESWKIHGEKLIHL